MMNRPNKFLPINLAILIVQRQWIYFMPNNLLFSNSVLNRDKKAHKIKIAVY